MKYFILFFIAVFIIATFKPREVDAFDQQLIIKAQQAADKISAKLTTNANQKGSITFASNGQTWTEAGIQAAVDRRNNTKRMPAYTLTWQDSNGVYATASSMGLDWKHHFVNSYLVGIRPFAVKNHWLPLYTLAQIKTYQLDDEQYGARDLWQNSAQAFRLPRGDCEDHAIALADWLISEGLDARVALGKYKTEGHAWVVVNKNNKTYLLEATSKRSGKSWNHYPLAAISQNYFPQYMFNRTDFWVNSTKQKTTDYLGKHWKKTSTFSR
ncbi:transglutaminase-like cysteine peptidase [Thalassomonas sp. M1454]|uniref:transglutaminase-like cysteine peptidase n=1 Tax=Thalassomonas sp. M1454 TaxID=2594477 RepID=UPI0011808E36|nr:transglutaminase-like cysteine peptidase [Thalassomonas sp. M1454]TRX56586.1 transglutaminase domain-containing protein [Thalassomonas sp. M1454]